MKDTTTIRLRPARPERQPRFAELNGAYWLETPIYAELASEWQDSGRAVPGPTPPAHRPPWQNMAADELSPGTAPDTAQD